MMKYRYARGANGSTYDILSLEDETRRSGSPYSCFGCGGELTPNIPKTNRTKYYSHKAKQNCSLETYLHRLAKLTFFETYKEALKQGQPFMFSFRREFLCSAFQEKLSYECSGVEVADFDLTTTYKQVTLEEKYGEFIPDIALISEKHPPIFVEIAVTHESSNRKTSSGAKIIEITIKNEADIEELRQRHISEQSSNVRTYGINGKTRTGNICGGNCKQNAEFFAVFHDGRAKILSAPLSDFYNKRSIYKILSPSVTTDSINSDEYQKLVTNLRHYLFEGVAIKNCLVCAHQTIGKYSGIWCRAKSKKIITADALKCKTYKPFTNLSEAQAAEKSNLAEHIARQEELVQKMISGYR